ncbi:DUF1702 family protein [Actinomadura sp. KC06]|uniref:DUF1702 family protein n=1 Tax=Actinomadura sp. KC06 TaxID=2530369 RepID=UPI0010429911|nr:DUF1702 family protein [Actinomadura sp. KC06]TDD35507.1 DUF1702 family protein [Actinomadura sp. KC06]
MATVLGSVRRLVLAPSLRDVTFVERGFPAAPAPATEHLEAIPQSVVCGFEWGIDASGLWELQRRLDMVTPELRGFAYEGATMACTVRDVMPGRGGRAHELLAGPGRAHIFLAYIGIGFAMARLPRMMWKKVLPDLKDSGYYPEMNWLAVDGYGFDLAYFDVKRWVRGQERPASYPWQGFPDYFPRAVDQGIGRALWFICGAQVADVGAAVRRFASGRHADLWSGVGLAAAFAGGSDPAGLAALADEAGEHRAELAQGAVFALKARSYAGHVPPSGEQAASALVGMPVPAIVDLADDTAPAGGRTDGRANGRADGQADGVPRYEHWRRNVRERLAALGPSRHI